MRIIDQWNFFGGECIFLLVIKLIYLFIESRSLAEFSRIPVVVTNQVRSQNHDEVCQYYFQGREVWSCCDILHVSSECNTFYSLQRIEGKEL